MSNLSNYAEHLIAEYLLGTGEVTRPTQRFVSLHTEDPGEDGLLAELPFEQGYARQEAEFGPALGSIIVNETAPLFGPPLANWGVVKFTCVWDAATAGNCLLHGRLAADMVVNAGEPVVFGPGSLRFIVD